MASEDIKLRAQRKKNSKREDVMLMEFRKKKLARQADDRFRPRGK